MALDRQSIEKRDFPVGRRGYDPDAVDAHLGVVAEEFESLRLASRRRTDSLAVAASEQVRSIVEAAESSAADIQRDAENEAREIRSDASRDAEGTRTRASTDAREHVERVSDSTDTMLQRLQAMDSELNALVESLRTGTNRLVADLSLLQGNMEELRSAAIGRGGTVEAVDEEQAEVQDAPAAETETRGADNGSPGDAETQAESETDEGARLIALNMALNGTPREETERYLDENFDLSDRDALLDEVYARVQ